jgi:hypothetical protein
LKPAHPGYTRIVLKVLGYDKVRLNTKVLGCEQVRLVFFILDGH